MIRFAVWIAVSSKQQARKDKASLDSQLADCRREAKRRGWTESAGPFSVPGQSRSRWLDLTTAAHAIPALAALIAAARRHEFDVLMVWDTTRFRDLLSPVHRFLEDQRIQLFSLAQPVEPVAPETYDPRDSDTTEILFAAQSMASGLESKHKQRRWRSGITGRVNSGMHFARIPWGYRKPLGLEDSRKAVLLPDPAKARILRSLKDRFLAGASLIQLADDLNTRGIPAAQGGRWSHTTIKLLLLNRFYTGLVTFGAVRSQRDRLSGRILTVPANPAQLVQLRGRHDPIWDDSTYALILDEFARRGHYTPGRTTRPLSGLMKCAVCGLTLDADLRPDPHDRVRWRCRSRRTGHARIANSLALDKLAAALRGPILKTPARAQTTSVRQSDDSRTEEADLLKRRQRWLDAFEAGTLSAVDFGDRIHALDDQLRTVRSQLQGAHVAVTRRRQQHTALQGLAALADRLPDYLRRGDPQEVNATLRGILASITVDLDRSLTLVPL